MLRVNGVEVEIVDTSDRARQGRARRRGRCDAHGIIGWRCFFRRLMMGLGSDICWGRRRGYHRTSFTGFVELMRSLAAISVVTGKVARDSGTPEAPGAASEPALENATGERSKAIDTAAR